MGKNTEIFKKKFIEVKMFDYTWVDIIEKMLREKKYADLWDYITALRGPDNTIYPLKILFTAPLRGNTSLIGYIGTRDLAIYLNTTEDKEIMRICVLENIPNVQHWFDHIKAAFKALYRAGFIERRLTDIITEMHDWETGLKELLEYYREKLRR